jgi:pimeloyl-ACP methyl ester carboxylesterase
MRIERFPSRIRSKRIKAGGATYYVRVGGQGPAVLLLHGFGDTGDMWAPVAKQLIDHHTVVVPDLRGMGLTSHPPGGYEKKTQGNDMARVLDALKIAISATWSAMRWPRNIPRALPNG